MSDPFVLSAESLSLMAKQLIGPLTEQVTAAVLANLSTPEVDELEIPDIDPTPPVVNTIVREHKQDDKIAEAYDEEEIALIRELKCPRLFTSRGKNGRSTTTNLTSQALQTLRDERADRKNWKHRV